MSEDKKSETLLVIGKILALAVVVGILVVLIVYGITPRYELQSVTYSFEAKLVGVKYYYSEIGFSPTKETILTFKNESSNNTYVFVLSGYHTEYFSNIGKLYKIDLYNDGSLADITKIEGGGK